MHINNKLFLIIYDWIASAFLDPYLNEPLSPQLTRNSSNYQDKTFKNQVGWDIIYIFIIYINIILFI